MSRTALRRAVGLSVLLITLSLALGSVHFGGTFAIWSASTSNAGSALEAGWIPPPTSLGTATPSGLGASLSWTAGAAPATGTKLKSADGGTGATASCGAYGSATTVTSPTTSGTTGTNGHWWCYKLTSTSATAWKSSAAKFTPIRVGLFPTTVAISNTGTAGTLSNGDKITITFNQNVGSVSGTKICQVAGASGTGVILIGDSTCSGSGDAYTIGKLTGVTVSGTGTQSRNMSAAVASAVVTVSITQNGRTVSGAPTFTASTSVSSSATPTATACTSASAPTCVVTATGGF